MAIMLRIRTRDGTERLTVENPNTITISHLKTLIETHLHIPIHSQILSLNQNLLLSKSPSDRARFTDLSNPETLITSLGITHGTVVYLWYDGEREIVTAPKPKFTPAGNFGKKMTMDDLIAKQMRITRQESPHCELVSFDRDAANVFQHYVNETLAFGVKRAGFMYGTVSESGRVEVNFIYEPPQAGRENRVILMRDSEEEGLVEAIALGLGMRRVGFIFTQSVDQNKEEYTMSSLEVVQAVELQAESGLKEWVTAMVKLQVNEDGGADVHFEVFQLSDMCVRLFKEELFDLEEGGEGGGGGGGGDPKVSRMKKDVVVGGKDVREVDNDFFLVVVKIFDHEGPLSTTFPVENRNVPVPMKALKTHLDRTKSLSFVKRISDFHLLLKLARHLDPNADIPALTQCVRSQSAIPEGYQLLIESLASAAP